MTGDLCLTSLEDLTTATVAYGIAVITWLVIEKKQQRFRGFKNVEVISIVLFGAFSNIEDAKDTKLRNGVILLELVISYLAKFKKHNPD